MANQIDESKPVSQTRYMSGRRVIKSSVKAITKNNVLDVLFKALTTHDLNRSEIDYLWKYYRGEQPIRNRVKDIDMKFTRRNYEAIQSKQNMTVHRWFFCFHI